MRYALRLSQIESTRSSEGGQWFCMVEFPTFVRPMCHDSGITIRIIWYTRDGLDQRNERERARMRRPVDGSGRAFGLAGMPEYPKPEIPSSSAKIKIRPIGYLRIGS
jgi:hypothetical protein